MRQYTRGARASHPAVLRLDPATTGCQYSSDEYQHFLSSHYITRSISAEGSYADNAAAESFFGTLKRERIPYYIEC
jgi:transposase InsO family protein